MSTWRASQPYRRIRAAALARELRSRPLLRDAVRWGRVRFRAAQVVLPVAVGPDEAAWVERAAGETVRALEKLVADARTDPDAGEEIAAMRSRVQPSRPFRAEQVR